MAALTATIEKRDAQIQVLTDQLAKAAGGLPPPDDQDVKKKLSYISMIIKDAELVDNDGKADDTIRIDYLIAQIRQYSAADLRTPPPRLKALVSLVMDAHRAHQDEVATSEVKSIMTRDISSF